jgi:hypothetical protein
MNVMMGLASASASTFDCKRKERKRTSFDSTVRFEINLKSNIRSVVD